MANAEFVRHVGKGKLQLTHGVLINSTFSLMRSAKGKYFVTAAENEKYGIGKNQIHLYLPIRGVEPTDRQILALMAGKTVLFETMRNKYGQPYKDPTFAFDAFATALDRSGRPFPYTGKVDFASKIKG